MEEKKDGKMNLFQKIQAVSMEVMTISKDMVVGKGNYAYKAVSDNQVTLAVKRAENKYKLISIPIKQEVLSSETLRLNDGQRQTIKFVENIKMTIRIVNLENPEESIEIESLGKGVDPADKGFGKASTYARKYALLNAYKIATGEDPDADKSTETKVQPINEKKNAIMNICLKDEKIKNNVLSHFNIGSLDDLSEKEVKTIYEQFKSKKLL